MRSVEDDYPFEICDADPETNALRNSQFNGDYGGFVKVGPKGYFFPKAFKEKAALYYNMETRPDQVFVGGYPRSGTTWTQQVVWLIVNDLNYEECEKTTMVEKFRYLEKQGMLPKPKNKEEITSIVNNFTQVKYVNGERFYKTHLPLSLLPRKLLETSKMVYVARDPRDVMVSYYHLQKGWYCNYTKDFRSFWNSFMIGILNYAPYFDNVKEFWEKRHNPNLLFLFYEDIVNDRLNTLRRIASFFNKSYTEEKLYDASCYLEFSNLKDKKSFNLSSLKELGVMKPDAEPFVRKGVVGGWREYFDEDMLKETNQWIADNLRDSDLRFPTIPDIL